ncbi:reverse transcriptase family protein [Methylobacterium radiodurans]|uniref:RNA-directed DNA polymerase n=1 Tax=Methylobacterium radiodurans TaxID=2202828 RepID=A0A2U8VP87_9HYPH|nr:reverse transcriptase family protein [Methylobacterium radiodurans]AWN35423.1 reverse transcriptase [Methylobacterium radiodurans]
MISSIRHVKQSSNYETEWRRYAAAFLSAAKAKKLSQDDIDACLQYAKPLTLGGFPVIYDTDHFCGLVGYTPHYVLGAIKSTDRYYRQFSIKKKSGGDRTILEPLPSLKEIQHWILRNVLERVAIHRAAKAFQKGTSIRDNARFHRGQACVLTIDIKDFFPSIGINRVFSVYHRIGYSKQISSLLADLSCFELSLPQGAPTSPYISNLICRSLDERFFAYARSAKLRYTRYADDLTFSGADIGSSFVSNAYEIIREYGFEPNLSKTRLLRQHQKQMVTGVVVNSKLQADRALRRQIRQYAYYIERFGLEGHAAATSVQRRNFERHLMGLAQFVCSLNPYDRDARNLIELLKID